MSDREQLEMVSAAEDPQTGGASSRNAANLLKNAAWECLSRGEADDAENLMLTALSIRQRAIGKNHRGLLPLLSAIAKLYTETKNFSEAEFYYQRALLIADQHSRPDKFREIELFEGYAHMLRCAGQTEEAAYIETALEKMQNDQNAIPQAIQLRRHLTSTRNVSTLRNRQGKPHQLRRKRDQKQIYLAVLVVASIASLLIALNLLDIL